jgi:hypothetical protein
MAKKREHVERGGEAPTDARDKRSEDEADRQEQMVPQTSSASGPQDDEESNNDGAIKSNHKRRDLVSEWLRYRFGISP